MFSLKTSQAQTLMMMDQYSEATTVLEKTIRLFAGSSIPSPCVHFNLASTQFQLKNFEKASVTNCLVKRSITKSQEGNDLVKKKKKN